MKRIAICPGSYDPVTNGHINIIERTALLFDEVIVLVLVNPNKQPMFTPSERVDFLKRATKNLKNVKIDLHEGLLAQYAKNIGACTLIKGLRAVTDFEFEFQQALTNKKLNPNLETMFMITDTNFMYLSSSILKQVGLFGGDVKEFVPPEIYDDVLLRITKK